MKEKREDEEIGPEERKKERKGNIYRDGRVGMINTAMNVSRKL